MSGIAGFGDLLLEHFGPDRLNGPYQRTLIVDAADAVVGGAAWNVGWYFGELGRPSVLLGHHGADARAEIAALAAVMPLVRAEFLQKRARTDRLLAFANISMPAVYLMGVLSDEEMAALCGRFTDHGLIIFCGSRHSALRARFLHMIRAFTNAHFVFSPSYTLYEYCAEEIRAFTERAHFTFINEHEAAFLSAKLGVSIEAAMALSRQGGVVTRGRTGATLYQRGGEPVHLPSISGVARDVVGAGEAFMCGFLDAHLAGRSFLDAGRAGIAVSAQVARGGSVREHLDIALVQREAGLA